jgi:predicted transglutaminase-like cysteine proteinase
MIVTGRTTQPIGHYEYCKTNSDDCSLRSNNVRPVKLTRERWNEIVSINDSANQAITPVTDLDLYNVEEYWTLPEKYGDCEDYVLLKRLMLMQSGWPASSLLVTVVRQPNGDGHAVLTVRTDRADYVLDNLETQVKPWAETEYQYLKRQSTANSGRWEGIDDSRTSVVGSVQ